MIQVIHGSIFDSKCDLLIVPCDSAGGVTRSVLTNLHERGLPTQVGPIPYGKVHFRESRYEFAAMIGYAASVDDQTITSEAEAIQNISREIVSYSTENQIRIVNVPLLGSGAGGMTPVDSFEALRSIFSEADSITFNVFCFTREVYRNLSAMRELTRLKSFLLLHPVCSLATPEQTRKMQHGSNRLPLHCVRTGWMHVWMLST